MLHEGGTFKLNNNILLNLQVYLRLRAVSIVTRLWAERAGFDSRQDNIFLFATTSRPTLGLSSLLSIGYRSYFLEVKRPRSEAEHSPPCSAEVKNAWRGAYLSNRDSFTAYL
jgi:hypothetical protein